MIALAILWLAWLVSWVLASGWSAKTETRQTSASRIAQSLPMWIGVGLIFASPGPLLATPISPLLPAREWMAAAVVALGLGYTWWARIHLGRFWSAPVTIKADHALIRSGPYALTRHPIYTGLLVAVLATAAARGTAGALVGFACVTFGVVLKLRHEEKFLTARFGDAYEAYRHDVPALIPRLWP